MGGNITLVSFVCDDSLSGALLVSSAKAPLVLLVLLLLSPPFLLQGTDGQSNHENQ